MAKIGRNDRCWCGSGQKHKKCHLGHDEPVAGNLRHDDVMPKKAFNRRTVGLPEARSASRGLNIINVQMEGSPFGIKINKKVQCPELSTEDLKELSRDEPEFVTRHVDAKHLPLALEGSFKFGTLAGYRAKENASGGRLGDVQESRQHEDIRTDTGNYEGIEIANNYISKFTTKNVHQPLLVETVANDYCSCSSVGNFMADRGQKLQDSEPDPDRKPGAFVTYHVAELKQALREWLIRERSDLSSLEFVGRLVIYDQKDTVLNLENGANHRSDGDSVAQWIQIAFLKSPRFQHEEEYRLLLVNPSRIGGLGISEDPIIIEADSKIKNSIKLSGYF